jgi:hypothetical protein
MSLVLMGSNRFENCQTLIAWGDHPVLKADAGLSSLQLDTTSMGEKIRAVRVEGKSVVVGKELCRLIASEVGTTVLFGGSLAILIATRIDEHTLHFKLDLRPLGLNIFDDTAGLHVGGTVIAGNSLNGFKVGIRLG